jgi:hypothetical protein
MNCQRFEEVVNDMAREQLIAVSLREQALAHSHECLQCARRLADEQRLTSRLRGLAAMESLEAPETVRAQLLQAFDQRPVAAPRRFAPVRPGSWMAIAAAVLLVIGIAGAMTLRWWRSVPVIPPAQLAVTDRRAQPEKPPDSPPSAPVPRPNRAPAIATWHRGKLTPRHDSNESATSSGTVSHHSREIATDFFLINYGAVPLAEGGRVVRLLVPRSAMARFGLPVNMDRANEPVKADVILGIDNLPQAIRFVQETASTDTPNSKQSPAPPQADARKPRKEKKS